MRSTVYGQQLMVGVSNALLQDAEFGVSVEEVGAADPAAR